MVAGAAKVRVTFGVDADGLLSVSAEELSTGVKSKIKVKPSYGLSDDQIANMLKDSIEHVQEDVELRRLREHIVDAERLLVSLDAALAEDGERLLSPQAY